MCLPSQARPLLTALGASVGAVLRLVDDGSGGIIATLAGPQVIRAGTHLCTCSHRSAVPQCHSCSRGRQSITVTTVEEDALPRRLAWQLAMSARHQPSLAGRAAAPQVCCTETSCFRPALRAASGECMYSALLSCWHEQLVSNQAILTVSTAWRGANLVMCLQGMASPPPRPRARRLAACEPAASAAAMRLHWMSPPQTPPRVTRTPPRVTRTPWRTAPPPGGAAGGPPRSLGVSLYPACICNVYQAHTTVPHHPPELSNQCS